MRTLPKTLRRLTLAIGLALTLGAPIFACGSGGSDSKAAEVDFHQTSELLPGLDFDTGLQPSGSPVQASFSITAKGNATIDAVAAASGSQSSPTLTGLPGKGTIGIDGDFALDGKLKIDVSGLPSYDGAIPGIENVKIAIKSTTAFDPFSIHHGVKARAAIPKTKLPSIPLPGGIPGDIALEVVEGSFVELTFTGTCAGADGTNATYEGTIARAGTLIIQPTIEIKVPIVGTKSYPIPKITVPLSLGSSDVEMDAKIKSFGDKPAAGDSVTATCKATGNGSGGGGGNAGTGGGNAGTGGGGGSGAGKDAGPGGICGSGSSSGDAKEDSCITKSCCEDFDTCTMHGSDIQGCLDCVNNGGGQRCAPFYACIQPCTGEICDSGLGLKDLTVAACLSMSCCAEFETCTANGTDLQACDDCLQANGGPLCDDAINCANMNCGGD